MTTFKSKKPLGFLIAFLVAFGSLVTMPQTASASGTETPSIVITLDGNGHTSGTVIQPAVYLKHIPGWALFIFPEQGDLLKTGYTFGGWNSNKEGTGTNYKVGQSKSTSVDTTYYANWIPIPKDFEFIVTFDLIGGTGVVQPLAGPANSRLILPSASSVAKAGYVLDSWNTKADGTGTKYLPGATYTQPYVNTTLYASWAKTATVSFNSNGANSGSIPAITVAAGSRVTLPTGGPFIRVGYYFLGWNTKADGAGTNYSGGTSHVFSQDITLYARWTPTKALITFNANGATGGSVPGNISNTIGSRITIPKQGNLVRAGHSFGGWNTKADGTGATYVGGSVIKLNHAGLSLFAKWTKNR